MRTLAIDFGLKRIGLAVSDSLQIIASPLENISGSHDVHIATRGIVELLQKLQNQGKQVGQIVIGLPLHMDGSESERSSQVRAFAECIKTACNLPVFLLDERLTSRQAERSLQERGFSRKKRTQFVDSVSAVILLQTYLSQVQIKKERSDVI